MTYKVKSNFLFLAAFIAFPCLSPAAQPGSFEELYGKSSLVKTITAESGLSAVPAARFSAAKALSGAAPEQAYESLLKVPAWKVPAQAAAAASDLSTGFGPARHQGSRNLCNAFAAVSLAEYLVWKKENVKPDFSEEFIYYNTKLNFTDTPDLQAYKAETGLPGYAAVVALGGGVVLETEWPFLPTLPQHAVVPPLTDPDIGTPPAGVAQKVLGYKFAPKAVRRTEIKQFLAAEHRPVVINLMLYTGNMDGATGSLRQPTAAQRQTCFSSGNGCGGHVVLLTGYDPKTKEYLFRNSWGASWGNAGYGRVPEAYVEQDCEACHFIPGLAGQNTANRTMIVNAAYGWSATLK